jgi:polysaccharide deacetylase 2 family uncharacterized protein YibQ
MPGAAAAPAGRPFVFALFPKALVCRGVLVAIAMLVLCGGVAANDRAPVALISIIIDDLGNNLQQGRRTIRLPGAVACAILPHTPFGVTLSREAYENHKQIILHLPMESTDAIEPGPGSLYLNMGPAEITATLESDLRSVPRAAGVSNHMGSLLTQRPEPMRWLMRALVQHGGLFFVDSRTTADTVAAKTATELGVPNLERNVFLDDDKNMDAITQQFERLLALARDRGGALALGHPYPETLAVLERRLPELQGSSVLLVAPSVLLEHIKTSLQRPSALEHARSYGASGRQTAEQRAR